MVFYGLNLQFYDVIMMYIETPSSFSKVKVKEQPIKKGKVKLEDYEIT
jgi:hypothetical protein